MTPVYLFCNCKPTMQMPSKGISSKKQQKPNRETAGCTGDLSFRVNSVFSTN